MTSTAIKLVVYPARDWQHALAALPPELTVVEFDVVGLGGSPRIGFQAHGVRVSAHVQLRHMHASRTMFLVYAGPFVTCWTDPPDGYAVFVEYDATPGDTVRALAGMAGTLARTKCHAAADHAPGIWRGAYGELCPACWRKVRDFLNDDTDPLPF